MRQQQTAIGNLVDDRRRRVDRDGHRVQRVVGITAHQAHRIPRLGKPRRVGLVQHLDDFGQPHPHRATPLSGDRLDDVPAIRDAPRPADIARPSRRTCHNVERQFPCHADCFVSAQRPGLEQHERSPAIDHLDPHRRQTGHHRGAHPRQLLAPAAASATACRAQHARWRSAATCPPASAPALRGQPRQQLRRPSA